TGGAGDTMGALVVIANNNLENSITRWDPDAGGPGIPGLFVANNLQADITVASTLFSTATTGGIPGFSNGSTVVNPIGSDNNGAYVDYNFNGSVNSIPAGF